MTRCSTPKRGHLFIAAAGNGDPAELESIAALHRDNVLTIAASDAQDRLASFSNSDPGVVDLAAPGTGVTSTKAGGGHEARDGTSVSVAFVAGRKQWPIAISPYATINSAAHQNRASAPRSTWTRTREIW